MRLYLKPDDGSITLYFLVMVTDMVLAFTYISSQLTYVCYGEYEDDQDKLVQLLIAFGVTGAMMAYCIGDAIRFLRNWPDRILYLISCFMQKPILLPILLHGRFFRSYIAT